jgi:Glycosyl hydrolases family 18/Ricin-type beta-trefoil lectin domain
MRKKILGLSVSILLAGCAVPSADHSEDLGSTSAAVTSGTTYQLKFPNLLSKCTDVSNNSPNDGANVQLWTCNGSSAQNWVANDVGGGYFTLQHQGTNECLNRDTSANNSNGGGNVQQWTCQWSGSAEYHWSFQASNNYQRIVNQFDGRCLDVSGSGTGDGTNIQTWGCNGTNAQTVNPVTGGGGGGGGGGSKTVGYVTSWVPNIYVPYSKLTHINYAFTVPNPDGSLTRNPENPGWLQTIVSNAHANGGKVLISVGGWMSDSPNPWAFASLAGNSGYRQNFRNNLINLVNAYNLDGVDIDWEYPCPGGNGGNYVTLMSELSGDMYSRGKLLSGAVAAFGANGDCVGTSVFNSVDHLNLMAYDIRDPNHSDYADAVNSINYWKGKGLAANKAVLGLPYYAHPSWSAYNTLVSQNGANRCRDNDGYNYWNGIPTIRAKSSYARSNAGGVMMWEMSQDTSGSESLTIAAWEAVNGFGGSYYCP